MAPVFNRHQLGQRPRAAHPRMQCREVSTCVYAAPRRCTPMTFRSAAKPIQGGYCQNTGPEKEADTVAIGPNSHQLKQGSQRRRPRTSIVGLSSARPIKIVSGRQRRGPPRVFSVEVGGNGSSSRTSCPHLSQVRHHSGRWTSRLEPPPSSKSESINGSYAKVVSRMTTPPPRATLVR